MILGGTMPGPRYVIVINWAPWYAGAELQIFGNWFYQPAAEDTAEHWRRILAAEFHTDYMPSVTVHQLSGKFVRNLKTAIAAVTVQGPASALAEDEWPDPSVPLP